MLRVLVRPVLTLAVVALVVIFVFPLVFELRVDVPTKIQFASASSMMFQISNQNLTSLTDVDYSCEVSNMTLASGSAVKDANLLSRGRFPKIGARRAVAGRCQTGYLIAAPLRTADYTLTIRYRAYPWRQLRTRVFHISAEFNGKNEVTGWKLD